MQFLGASGKKISQRKQCMSVKTQLPPRSVSSPKTLVKGSRPSWQGFIAHDFQAKNHSTCSEELGSSDESGSGSDELGGTGHSVLVGLPFVGWCRPFACRGAPDSVNHLVSEDVELVVLLDRENLRLGRSLVSEPFVCADGTVFSSSSANSGRWLCKS